MATSGLRIILLKVNGVHLTRLASIISLSVAVVVEFTDVVSDNCENVTAGFIAAADCSDAAAGFAALAVSVDEGIDVFSAANCSFAFTSFDAEASAVIDDHVSDSSDTATSFLAEFSAVSLDDCINVVVV